MSKTLTKEVKEQIAIRNLKIFRLKYDLDGNSAFKNTRRIEEIQVEIDCLKRYGVANPSWWKRVWR